MFLSKRIASVLLACVVPGISMCGSPGNGDTAERKIAWLGSAEGWGLLGLARQEAALVYRGAVSLESPTWSPPELLGVARTWPGDNAIWAQFSDGSIGRYRYRSGRLTGYDRYPDAEAALSLGAGLGLIVATREGGLELVGGIRSWDFAVDGDLRWLERAGGGNILAVVEDSEQTEFLVLDPPVDTVLGRASLGGVRDLSVLPWGDRVYLLSDDDGDAVVHGFALPDLTKVEEYELPAAGRALALTPSGHRLYVAVGPKLHVFDVVRGEKLREVQLPMSAASLRFGSDGAHLLARSSDGDSVVVLQVGIDEVLGAIEAEWDDHLPTVVGGGRLVASLGQELLLFDLPSLDELARVEVDVPRLWVAVEWQPPRPRSEPARRAEVETPARPAVAGADQGSTVTVAESGEAEPSPGFYAVVLAARERSGVDELVNGLRDSGYPAATDEHRDVTGVVWFRAMVGPYSQRAAVEEAARSLSSRYGYKPWILSVEAGGV